MEITLECDVAPRHHVPTSECTRSHHATSVAIVPQPAKGSMRDWRWHQPPAQALRWCHSQGATQATRRVRAPAMSPPLLVAPAPTYPHTPYPWHIRCEYLEMKHCPTVCPLAYKRSLQCSSRARSTERRHMPLTPPR
jgi:hypothetical protein